MKQIIYNVVDLDNIEIVTEKMKLDNLVFKWTVYSFVRGHFA